MILELQEGNVIPDKIDDTDSVFLPHLRHAEKITAERQSRL